MISDLDFTYEVVFVFLSDHLFYTCHPLLPLPLVFYESSLRPHDCRFFYWVHWAYMKFFVTSDEILHSCKKNKFLHFILTKFLGIECDKCTNYYFMWEDYKNHVKVCSKCPKLIQTAQNLLFLIKSRSSMRLKSLYERIVNFVPDEIFCGLTWN